MSGANEGRSLALTDRGEGPVVVLLHGQPGEGRDWETVADRLADRMRVVVPDRPGYGRSGARAVGVAANAELIVGLLDRLGVDRAVVAGHSWSGGVALDLAQRHPDRVSALVLVGAVGGQGSVDHLDQLLATPLVGSALSLVGLSVLRAPRLGRLVAHVALPTRTDLVVRPGTGWFRSWRSFVVEQRALVAEMPGITARLGEVTVPAVVVVGDQDRVVRPRSQAALAAALPGGRLLTLAGIGHLVPQEVPEQVAEAIAAFRATLD